MCIPLLLSLLSLIMGYDEAQIVFAGDAMMHQQQLDVAKRGDGTYDFSEYFKTIEPYVVMADYAVVNLETAVSTPPYSGYPCFNAPQSYVDVLQDAGFDLFLTANNHTLDRRDKGLCNTLASLDNRRLDHIGTYASQNQRDSVVPFIKNINGIRVGFLNYTYGTNGFTPGKEVRVDYIDRELIRSDVEKTRAAGAEIIAACIHWGVEYNLLPHPSQTSLAEYLRSLSVEIVMGGHPHVVQPIELTKNADGIPHLLVYSLGNFISNMRTRDTRGGALMSVTLRRGVDGKVRIADASYRLVFTEPADGKSNFRLNWVDRSNDPRAAEFARAAREMYKKNNIGVAEDFPFSVTNYKP